MQKTIYGGANIETNIYTEKDIPLEEKLRRSFGNCDYRSVTILKDLRPQPRIAEELDQFGRILGPGWQRLWAISDSVLLIIGDKKWNWQELADLLGRTSFLCIEGTTEPKELARLLHDNCGLEL